MIVTNKSIVEYPNDIEYLEELETQTRSLVQTPLKREKLLRFMFVWVFKNHSSILYIGKESLIIGKLISKWESKIKISFSNSNPLHNTL